VITKSIEPYSIVVGIPGRVVKMRYKTDVVNLLEEIKWWNWDSDKIKRNQPFFISNLNKLSIDSIKKLLKK
jgi:virginiamycin A acetyltransferase